MHGSNLHIAGIHDFSIAIHIAVVHDSILHITGIDDFSIAVHIAVVQDWMSLKITHYDKSSLSITQLKMKHHLR